MTGHVNVEAQIRAAQERGDFDDLPGKGEPLALPAVYDPDWWVKSYVAREGIDTAALVHPTIALRREADTFPGSLAVLTTEEQVRAVLEDFNRRVAAEWRRPQAGRGLPVVARPVSVEPMVERWRALGAERGSTEPLPSEPAPSVTGSEDPGGRCGPWWRRQRARMRLFRAPCSTSARPSASSTGGT